MNRSRSGRRSGILRKLENTDRLFVNNLELLLEICLAFEMCLEHRFLFHDV